MYFINKMLFVNCYFCKFVPNSLSSFMSPNFLCVTINLFSLPYAIRQTIAVVPRQNNTFLTSLTASNVFLSWTLSRKNELLPFSITIADFNFVITSCWAAFKSVYTVENVWSLFAVYSFSSCPASISFLLARYRHYCGKRKDCMYLAIHGVLMYPQQATRAPFINVGRSILKAIKFVIIVTKIF